MTRLNVGDQCPLFSVKNKDGMEIKASDFIGKKPFVLFFFPNNIGYYCKSEVCEFRDAYEKFCEFGVEVIGASPNSVQSHNRFAEKHKIPFNLVVDEGRKLAKTFGVDGFLITDRVTFIIDITGKIVFSHSALLKSTQHIEESLKLVETLSAN
ncbi:hypothetical protein ACTFIR_003249 [Dictyostelium discoideum]